MIERREWKEFRNNGLLWFVNKFLVLYGWTIILVRDEDDNVIEVFPAKVKSRSISEKANEIGCKLFNNYVENNLDEIEEGQGNEGLEEYYEKTVLKNKYNRRILNMNNEESALFIMMLFFAMIMFFI